MSKAMEAKVSQEQEQELKIMVEITFDGQYIKEVKVNGRKVKGNCSGYEEIWSIKKFPHGEVVLEEGSR